MKRVAKKRIKEKKEIKEAPIRKIKQSREGKKFFKAYFILAFIFGIAGLTDYIISKVGLPQYALGAWNLLGFAFTIAIFVLSIIAIVKFKKHKFKKITFVLPIYYLVMLVATFLYGFFIGFISAMQGADYTVSPLASTIAMIGSIFEILFSFYILRKFK